jgi:hypothetical protein
MPRPDMSTLAQVAATHISSGRWATYAACTDVPLADFFADDPTPAAQAACVACPVRLDCLADEIGQASVDIHGYRAGLEEQVRRRVLARAAALRPAEIPEPIRLAVAAVARGTTVSEVAVALGVSRRTVHRWISAA